jgi:hypothetical protein
LNDIIWNGVVLGDPPLQFAALGLAQQGLAGLSDDCVPDFLHEDDPLFAS